MNVWFQGKTACSVMSLRGSREPTFCALLLVSPWLRPAVGEGGSSIWLRTLSQLGSCELLSAKKREPELAARASQGSGRGPTSVQYKGWS